VKNVIGRADELYPIGNDHVIEGKRRWDLVTIPLGRGDEEMFSDRVVTKTLNTRYGLSPKA
jgi:hypothetical protein